MSKNVSMSIAISVNTSLIVSLSESKIMNMCVSMSKCVGILCKSMIKKIYLSE